MQRRGAWSHVGNVARQLVQHRVPRGDGQTRATLDIMARTARSGAVDPDVVDAAVSIVRQIHGRDRLALISALGAWSHARLMFIEDPRIDGDWIRSPRKLLGEIRAFGQARGDCDDAAVLLAALGTAIGLPARFHAVSFSSSGPFVHVWTELYDGRQWVALDPTREGQPMERIRRSMLLEV